MSDALDLHPLLADVVRDHEQYRDAREMGRRAAEETLAVIEAGHERLRRHLDACARYGASAPLTAREPLSLAEGLNMISAALRPSPDGTNGSGV